MKVLIIQIVFLVLILMAPVVLTSITELVDVDYWYEQCENFPEEQRNDRESEEKGGENAVAEFVLHNRLNFATLGGKISGCFPNSKEFAGISKNVLTPPPNLSKTFRVRRFTAC